MYLDQLKEEYPLIYDRVVAQSNLSEDRLNDRNRDVSNTLTWSATTEGQGFWTAVYREEWDEARLLQPTLFKELEKGTLLLSVNGLFKVIKSKEKTNV